MVDEGRDFKSRLSAYWVRSKIDLVLNFLMTLATLATIIFRRED